MAWGMGSVGSWCEWGEELGFMQILLGILEKIIIRSICEYTEKDSKSKKNIEGSISDPLETLGTTDNKNFYRKYILNNVFIRNISKTGTTHNCVNQT